MYLLGIVPISAPFPSSFLSIYFLVLGQQGNPLLLALLPIHCFDKGFHWSNCPWPLSGKLPLKTATKMHGRHMSVIRKLFCQMVFKLFMLLMQPLSIWPTVVC